MTSLEFPLQIGLIGAPDSGKSLVASQFEDISDEWFRENKSEFDVFENPGTIIERRDDTAMGVFGDYSDDIRAHFIRHEQETDARRRGVSWLTPGTIVDNIAHCGINLEHIVTGLSTPDQEQRIQRQQITMSMLTFLFLEKFRYLFGFYIPYQGTSIVLPGQPEPSNYPARIDMGIRTVMSNFGLRVQVLDQPTVEDKAQEMFDTVKRIMENGPERPPEVEPEDVPAEASATLSE